jgi:hypothetical protein
VYHKISRWSDEDAAVAVDTEERAEREETAQADDEPRFVTDYRRRIHPDDGD